MTANDKIVPIFKWLDISWKMKRRDRNSCPDFLLNLNFHGARFVWVEVEIIYAIFMLLGDKDGKKRGPWQQHTDEDIFHVVKMIILVY